MDDFDVCKLIWMYANFVRSADVDISHSEEIRLEASLGF